MNIHNTELELEREFKASPKAIKEKRIYTIVLLTILSLWMITTIYINASTYAPPDRYYGKVGVSCVDVDSSLLNTVADVTYKRDSGSVYEISQGNSVWIVPVSKCVLNLKPFDDQDGST